MKLLRADRVAILLLSLFIVFSACNKDDDDDSTKPSLTGSLITDMPSFALVGETVTANASGITYPESGISYWWYNSAIIKDTIHGQVAEFTIPDSLATYSIVVYAECDGYYSSVYTKSITAIKPGTGLGASLSGFPKDRKFITDSRDGQIYYYKQIGNLYWLTNNLNWGGAGKAYDDCNAAGIVFGRYYTWDEATGGKSAEGLANGPQGVCPEGWTIPTKEDWEDLAKAMNNGNYLSFSNNWDKLGEMAKVPAKFNGSVMWPFSANCSPSNAYEWDAIPAGYAMDNYKSFEGLYRYGMWWSATEYNSQKASYRYVFYDQADFPMNYTDKSGLSASVRCVKKI